MIPRARLAGVLAVSMVVGAVSGGPARAADQTVLGKKLLIRNPTGDPFRQSMIGQGREGPGSPNTVVGDPTTGGALLRVFAHGGTDTDVTLAMPASGWSPIGSIGFKYSGRNIGAIRTGTIKRTSDGGFQIKVTWKGFIIPPDPGNDGGFVLSLGGGDDYCVTFGGAAGGVEREDDARAWLVTNATAEACPPPTTTTTTTVPPPARAPTS
jgi:hypothetical protein